MRIEFKRLTEVSKSSIIDLMNNPLVRRQMPLLSEYFDESACDKFVATKEKLWTDYGYGPWAFFVDGHFAGWGGLQPEHGEADLALVLHPKYWGIGKSLYKRIIDTAFNEMGLTTITVLFPNTRVRIKGLLRLGFIEDGNVKIGEQQFVRFRKQKRIMN